jgi:hypothetical protein
MTELIGSLVDLLIGIGTVFRDESCLLRLEQAPFAYPVADVDHETIKIWNNGILE